MNIKRLVVAILLFALLAVSEVCGHNIKGKIYDSKNGEPLIGATIEVDGGKQVAITDINGNFELQGIAAGVYNLLANYVSYKTVRVENVSVPYSGSLDIPMDADEQLLNAGSVVGVMRKDTEIAMVNASKISHLIVSNVSSQEIARSQDSNAGEVIRRVPGVSLIEDKFVMVRGLSQRYNNVWINGGAVPSSEADSRAFSFDIIPSAQIDNLNIVKVPSPEYPADYSGGFIIINTKEIPEENDFSISLGGNWNTLTVFNSFERYNGSATDFLGFDGGRRALCGGMYRNMNKMSGDNISLQNNSLDNDWKIRSIKPYGDLRLSAAMSRHWKVGGSDLGMTAVANYTNEFRTYENMQNNLFGVYDAANDKSNYLRWSVDDQYNNNVRFGAMVNITLLTTGGSKLLFKNIFNQLGTDRYTFRKGISAQSDHEESAEYYYRSRTTYNGQVNGLHVFGGHKFDWSTGYAYSNRILPDRRRYLLSDANEADVIELITGNDVSREWTRLGEHIVSFGVNDTWQLEFGKWKPILKYGAFGEYRTRTYDTRSFIYSWHPALNNLPEDFQSMDIRELLSNEAYFGDDLLYMLEEWHMKNNYRGKNTLGAGYIGADLPFGKISAYAGVRFEYSRMELISNTSDTKKRPLSHFYGGPGFFPSINVVYKFNDRHQVRASYGRSINRAEFREVSPSVYYDFDLASNVAGNTGLRNCYVDNVDLRYEMYPGRGEILSIAAFYKHFDSPIEWTYTVAGGTDLIYSYMNARSANNYGMELDLRKDLSFMGLRGFKWSFNGTLIRSRVEFAPGSKEKDRPMQGQSPYLVNTGVFYANEAAKINLGLLYNRIGKRIIGVGRSEGSTGSDDNARVPDSYEMPRNVLDFTASKKFGKHTELKMSIRDILAEKVSYMQFTDVVLPDGESKAVSQTAKEYRPGRNISFTILFKF